MDSTDFSLSELPSTPSCETDSQPLLNNSANLEAIDDSRRRLISDHSFSSENTTNDNTNDETPDFSKFPPVKNNEAQPTTIFDQEALSSIGDHAGQEPETNIDISIAENTQTKFELNISPNKNKAGKSHKKKISIKKFDFPDVKVESQTQKLKKLGITEDSPEFSYGGETISVCLDKLLKVQKQGQGAFGKVFSMVLKNSKDIPIAVKHISCTNIKATEVAIMQDICRGSNEHIIDYYGAFINPKDNSLYILMEFMDASLEEFYNALHTEEHFMLNEIDRLSRRIIHDVTSGLEYMARKQIVHRDIKPSNILINKSSTIKLCDFGISRTYMRLDRYCENVLDCNLSPLSPLVHTENYMPPEVTCTFKDDMWALGVSLLEIISGENPFSEWKSHGRYFELMKWKPIIPEIVSKDMQELILKLLEKTADKRPDSYENILQMQFIKNVLETASYDESEFVRRIIEKITRPVSDE